MNKIYQSFKTEMEVHDQHCVIIHGVCVHNIYQVGPFKFRLLVIIPHNLPFIFAAWQCKYYLDYLMKQNIHKLRWITKCRVITFTQNHITWGKTVIDTVYGAPVVIKTITRKMATQKNYDWCASDERTIGIIVGVIELWMWWITRLQNYM